VEAGEHTRVKVATGGGTILSEYPSRPGDEGMKVNVGIRPEDMIATEEADYAFSGTVEISENLGEVTVLYFGKQGDKDDQVIAKLHGIHTEVRGREVHMAADPSKVHLFADGISLAYR